MRQPSDTEGILIVGRRGSGKTQEAIHQLSLRDFDKKPWICLDFKGGDLLSQIPVSADLTIHDPIPTEPGVYVVQAEIEDHGRGGPVDDYLLRIFQVGNTGLLIDEVLMCGQHSRGLRLILTQGRSKHIPTILCAQRPFSIEVWSLSESEYLQVFPLQLAQDQQRINEFIPSERFDFDMLRSLGRYHSALYDVREDKLEFVEPCPRFEDIYDRIRYRLPKYEDIPKIDPGARIRV